MAEPVTEAGRAMLSRHLIDGTTHESCLGAIGSCDVVDAIVAIEQEARAALLAELRAKVEALPNWSGDWRSPSAEEAAMGYVQVRDRRISRATVLEAMEAMQRALGS